MKRRTFIAQTATIAAVGSVYQALGTGSLTLFTTKVRCGFIGVGARGLGTLSLALLRKDIVVTAICDIDPITTEKAVKMVNGKLLTEASGGVNLKTVGDIAKTGVNYISVGALTHSAPALDIGLDIDVT